MLLGESNLIILGDLNADCAYLPGYLRANVLPQGWTWHISDGVATNTGRVLANGTHTEAGTSCAYDRFILDQGAQAYDRAEDGIDRTGIANRLDAKQVSDHYLIHMALGEQRNKKRKVVGSFSSVLPMGSPKTRKRSAGPGRPPRSI